MTRSVLLAVVLLSAVVHAKASHEDVKGAKTLVSALAESADLDADMRQRLLMQGCSEIPSCAAGDDKGLSACGGGAADPSQCAAILSAAPHLDFKAQHDKDATLTPGVWIEAHVKKSIADIAPAVDAKSKKSFAADRKKARL